MNAALLIGLGAALAVAAAMAAARAPLPTGRTLGGGALLLAAIALAALRQFALALPVGFLALGMLRAAVADARATPQAGQRSEVRTDALAMSLDHDTGEMDGEVLSGRFSGRFLSDLSTEELQALAEELEADADSLGLLLAYLERRRGGSDAGPDAADARDDARRPEPDREMSAAEALSILGLDQGASLDEIRSAHRRLIKKVHPDLGGTDGLAAMINAAKARLDP